MPVLIHNVVLEHMKTAKISVRKKEEWKLKNAQTCFSNVDHKKNVKQT